jgi:hypothetical protein
MADHGEEGSLAQPARLGGIASLTFVPCPPQPPLAYDTCTRDDRLIMNQSQQEAVDRVFEILSEHFDHVVIAVGTYDEDKQYTTAASFTGGVAAAIGLCKLYEAKWTKEHLWGPDDHDQDDDSNGR